MWYNIIIQNIRMFISGIVVINLLFRYIVYDRYQDSSVDTKINVDQNTHEVNNDSNITNDNELKQMLMIISDQEKECYENISLINMKIKNLWWKID